MCTMCSSQGNVIMGNAEADKRQENAWRRTCKLNGEGDNNMRMRFRGTNDKSGMHADTGEHTKNGARSMHARARGVEDTGPRRAWPHGRVK
jgi:hypothetical protein